MASQSNQKSPSGSADADGRTRLSPNAFQGRSTLSFLTNHFSQNKLVTHRHEKTPLGDAKVDENIPSKQSVAVSRTKEEDPNSVNVEGRHPNTAKEIARSGISSGKRESCVLLEGQSTLSFLTSHFQKEEARRKLLGDHDGMEDKPSSVLPGRIPREQKEVILAKNQNYGVTKDGAAEAPLPPATSTKKVPHEASAALEKSSLDRQSDPPRETQRTQKQSNMSLQGRSTLSFLTNHFQEEKARQRPLAAESRKQQDLAVVEKGNTPLAQPLNPAPSKGTETKNQEETTSTANVPLAPQRRRSLPLKKRPVLADWQTNTDKENATNSYGNVGVGDTGCKVAIATCRDEEKKQGELDERASTAKDKIGDGHPSMGVEENSSLMEMEKEDIVSNQSESFADYAGLHSATTNDSQSTIPSSMRYLDPAALSALSNRARNFPVSSNKPLFMIGPSSSVWGAQSASTDWSTVSLSNFENHTRAEAVKEIQQANGIMLPALIGLVDGVDSCTQEANHEVQEVSAPSTHESAIDEARNSVLHSTSITPNVQSTIEKTVERLLPTALQQEANEYRTVSVAPVSTVAVAKGKDLTGSTVVVKAFNSCTRSTEVLAIISFVENIPATVVSTASSSKRSVPTASELSNMESSDPFFDEVLCSPSSGSLAGPRKKRKRLRRLAECKENSPPTKRRKEQRSDTILMDDDMWMSDDVHGLVQTRELPHVATPPHGENPWAYLFEPNAPRFELDVFSRAERRATTNFFGG